MKISWNLVIQLMFGGSQDKMELEMTKGPEKTKECFPILEV